MKSALGPRSELSPTRSTKRWPRRPTDCTKPNASTGPTPTAGTTSIMSSWPRCRGSTGSTTTGFTLTATTHRQQSSKRRSTLPNKPTTHWFESNNQSLHQTQGGSLAGDRRQIADQRVGLLADNTGGAEAV